MVRVIFYTILGGFVGFSLVWISPNDSYVLSLFNHDGIHALFAISQLGLIVGFLVGLILNDYLKH